jgi:3-dehydrosphinganine reductase
MARKLLRSYHGVTALVTGGSSGIGLAMAQILASKGANIWLLARDGKKLEAACRAVSEARLSPTQAVHTIQADVADQAQVASALQPVIDRGGVELLVNSAGITYPGLFEELDTDIFRQMMDVNYFGTLHVTKALVPAMLKRGSGHIVNISSLVGRHGLYGYSAYSPSKFAVGGLSDTLRYELQPHGINISIAFPADTQTPQLDFDNEHKPPILKMLASSNTSVASAELVAENILRDVLKGKYLIFPSFDSSILHVASVLLPGHALYWFVDRLMADARRRVAKDLAGK